MANLQGFFQEFNASKFVVFRKELISRFWTSFKFSFAVPEPKIIDFQDPIASVFILKILLLSRTISEMKKNEIAIP